MWKDMCDKSRHIFMTAILPELVGKFFTRLPFSKPLSSLPENAEDTKSKQGTDSEVELWCFCNQVESGKMIYCENDDCDIHWFHYLCLGISTAPRGKWYCPDCRKLPKFQSRRGNRK